MASLSCLDCFIFFNIKRGLVGFKIWLFVWFVLFLKMFYYELWMLSLLFLSSLEISLVEREWLLFEPLLMLG